MPAALQCTAPGSLVTCSLAPHPYTVHTWHRGAVQILERLSNLVPVPLGEVSPLPHVPRLLPAPVPGCDGRVGVGGEGVLAVVHDAGQVVAVRPREALARSCSDFRQLTILKSFSNLILGELILHPRLDVVPVHGDILVPV